MSHTITKYDATILNRHAKRGDTLELSRTLDILAQRETPNGMDRADILLLAKDETGDNVIHSACALGNKNIIEFVYGLNDFTLKPGILRSIINARNDMGNTAVHIATMNNEQACVTALLERGADITAEGSFGFRVAHFAARDGKPDMLRYLLQRGADSNAVTRSGDTPAHFAARNQDMLCLRALRAGGATLRGLNMAYDTPASIAARLGNQEMIAWMREQNIF
ncbi:Transcription factor mbp1 [Diaporthe eres]|uniref:Transcription factor mbp1 n=1 Tax=Diaporthe eres TaxID=83184 RepID=A0ABR1PFU0_DIAER